MADHGSEPVLRLERVGRTDRNSLLAEAGIKAADDFILPEEPDHAVFELTIELHVVVEVEILRAGEFCGRGPRFLHRVCDVHKMVSAMLIKAYRAAEESQTTAATASITTRRPLPSFASISPCDTAVRLYPKKSAKCVLSRAFASALSTLPPRIRSSDVARASWIPQGTIKSK